MLPIHSSYLPFLICVDLLIDLEFFVFFARNIEEANV